MALAMMLAKARSSSASSPITGGTSSDRSRTTSAEPAPMLVTASASTSSSTTTSSWTSTRSRLQTAHVEEAADQAVEAVGLLVDRRQQLVLCLLGPVHVVLQQAGRRGLDGRERSAQVVRDAREDARAQLVRRGEALGARRPPPPAPRARWTPPAPWRRPRACARPRSSRGACDERDEDVLGVDLDDELGDVERDRRTPARRLHPPLVVDAVEQRRAVEAERAAQPVEDRRGARGPREAHQRLGLGARARRLGRSSRGERDEAAHRDGDRQEDEQGEHVLGVADGPRVERRRQEPVDEEEAADGDDQRRPQAADRRHADDEQQEEQQGTRRRHLVASLGEHPREERRADRPESEPQRHASARKRARPAQLRLRSGVRLGVGLAADDVHVEAHAREPDHGADDRAVDELAPAASAPWRRGRSAWR